MVVVTYRFDQNSETKLNFTGSIAAFCARKGFLAKLDQLNADLVCVNWRYNNEDVWNEIEDQEVANHTTPLVQDCYLELITKKKASAAASASLFDIAEVAQPIHAVDPTDGLAPIHIMRTAKITNLIRFAEKNRRVLFIAPPFTGKTATAQLIQNQLLEQKRKVLYISFKSLMSLEPTMQMLMDHVSLTANMPWEKFASIYFCNQNNIVITDESQAAFHENIRSFWRLFKTPGCILFAFASIASPSSSPLPCCVTPAEFHKPPAVFSDIALSKKEFDQLADEFIKQYPLISHEMVRIVADSVSARFASRSKSTGVILTEFFHPGLTQACFQKLSELTMTMAPDKVLGLIQTRGNLYNLAKQLGGERCFASLAGYHSFFERTMAKYNKFVAFHLTRMQEFKVSPDEVKKASTEFPYRFQNLLIKLITHDFISSEYQQGDWLSMIYHEIMTRSALVCVTFDEQSTPVTFRLSCKLYKEHFLSEMRREYGNLKPLKSLNIESAEKYAIDIISKFDPNRLPYSYQKSPSNDVIFESGFHFEFCHVANLFGTEAVCPEFRFISDSNEETGRIDCVVTANGCQFGIEFLRMSDILEHHHQRDYEVNDYCIIDFHENKLPTPTQYSNLVDKKTDHYFDKTLTVLLFKSPAGVYESVKFFKFNSQSRTFVHLAQYATNLVSTRQQFVPK